MYIDIDFSKTEIYRLFKDVTGYPDKIVISLLNFIYLHKAHIGGSCALAMYLKQKNISAFEINDIDIYIPSKKNNSFRGHVLDHSQFIKTRSQDTGLVAGKSSGENIVGWTQQHSQVHHRRAWMENPQMEEGSYHNKANGNYKPVYDDLDNYGTTKHWNHIVRDFSNYFCNTAMFFERDSSTHVNFDYHHNFNQAADKDKDNHNFMTPQEPDAAYKYKMLQTPTHIAARIIQYYFLMQYVYLRIKRMALLRRSQRPIPPNLQDEVEQALQKLTNIKRYDPQQRSDARWELPWLRVINYKQWIPPNLPLRNEGQQIIRQEWNARYGNSGPSTLKSQYKFFTKKNLQLIFYDQDQNFDDYINMNYDFTACKVYTTLDIDNPIKVRDTLFSENKIIDIPNNWNRIRLIACFRTVTLRYFKYLKRGFVPITYKTRKNITLDRGLKIMSHQLKLYVYKKLLDIIDRNVLFQLNDCAHHKHVLKLEIQACRNMLEQDDFFTKLENHMLSKLQDVESFDNIKNSTVKNVLLTHLTNIEDLVTITYDVTVASANVPLTPHLNNESENKKKQGFDEDNAIRQRRQLRRLYENELMINNNIDTREHSINYTQRLLPGATDADLIADKITKFVPKYGGHKKKVYKYIKSIY
tara:strand:- start:14738 stop:16657 length:1920 start_codon:yes stop_codon:yes gene_type:complete